MDATRLRLELTGAVQGVGFRPYVVRLARDEGLAGFVCNTGAGVCIEVEGTAPSVERFAERVGSELPAHAMVETRRVTALAPAGQHGFDVVESAADGAGAVVMADIATCAACLREVLDPGDRRVGYPFTTCTQCGPRYSVIAALPYDRARTVMRAFPMCVACAAEYRDPGSRRFHAESIACPDCGPRSALWDATGTVLAGGQDAVRDAAMAVREGRILAVKGLGGFQLMVDAGNAAAVARLRQRKRRPRKPFAVMVGSIEEADRLAHIDDVARALLLSPAAPIVLLRRRGDGVAREVAPDMHRLGIMLPCTPLHHLLLRAIGRPVVATSGNRGDEPIVCDEADAVGALEGIADVFLVHDRPILHAVDDSVVCVMSGEPVVLRRARGYAPLPIACDAVTKPVLALGGQQKAAVAVGDAGQLVLGPHIGDLGTARTRDAFAEAVAQLPRSQGVSPAVVACDRHPDYHSTHVAQATELPVVPVPHHLAHVLAGMVDNGLDGPVLGVAWDGTGYGGDGTVWGGEFIIVADGRFRRAGHLLPFRLPGGEAAVREPRRVALGVLHTLSSWAERSRIDDRAPDDRDCFAARALTAGGGFAPAEIAVLRQMLAQGVNAPLTSSMGRLFDAVAALLGLCQVSSFEGEAAMAVEAAADRAARMAALPCLTIDPQGRLDWRALIAALVAEQDAGAAVESLAAAFHERLAEAIVSMAGRIGLQDVMLTGGCFQNARLTERSVALLRAAGFTAHWHHRIPPNDGGLAAGQVVFAARPLVEEHV